MATIAATLTAGCGGSDQPAPPVATPSLAINHDRAAAGSPLELTYKFVVAPDAAIKNDYRVMVHVVDTDEELMWTDDHNPPVPTSQWKPGQTVEYTRTVFVPIFPYVGDASVHVGLYSASDQSRLPLGGEDVGQRAYRVARLHVLPQTENLFTVFKDGWHPAEVARDNATVEWQWTKGEATLAFKNPKKDAVFYLDVDSPGSNLHDAQQVEVSVGGAVIDSFSLPPDTQVLRKVPLKAGQLGQADMAELQLRVADTFVPSKIPTANSKDYRELGVRVFHAFVDHRDR
jgi:hypothetical protein